MKAPLAACFQKRYPRRQRPVQRWQAAPRRPPGSRGIIKRGGRGWLSAHRAPVPTTRRLPPLAPRGDALVFSHLSFQEHLVAEAIGVTSLFGDAAKLESSWWGDVMLAAWALADEAERKMVIATLDTSARKLAPDADVIVVNEAGRDDLGA